MNKGAVMMHAADQSRELSHSWQHALQERAYFDIQAPRALLSSLESKSAAPSLLSRIWSGRLRNGLTCKLPYVFRTRHPTLAQTRWEIICPEELQPVKSAPRARSGTTAIFLSPHELASCKSC